MKKKMKRYEEGGDVIELESKTGPNKNIGDDVRARAMAAMEKGSSDEPAVPKKTAEKLTPKAAPKAEPKAEPKAAPKAKESAFKEGTSSFKETPSTFKKGTSSFKDEPKDEPKEEPKKKASTTIDPSTFGKTSLPKSFSASGGNTEPKKSTAKFSSPSISLPDPLAKFKKMASGGKVSSASKRADGCAIRGKTRA